jgi:hypothetical protein
VAALADALRRSTEAHEAESGEADPTWPGWYPRHMADETVGQDAEHEPAGA